MPFLTTALVRRPLAATTYRSSAMHEDVPPQPNGNPRPLEKDSANEHSFVADSGLSDNSIWPPSDFRDSDLMNYAVRMVIPMRREFARQMDVSHFMHDDAYAREIIEQAGTSTNARLRGYAALLAARMSGAPAAGPAAATPTPTGPAEAPATDAMAPLALAEAKRFVARRLLDALGPTAELLCLKIEAAPTITEVITQARRAHAAVRDIRGVAEADRFGAEVEARLKALAPVGR